MIAREGNPARYNFQEEIFMNNCLCNLFDDCNIIWIVIIALLVLSCCCNG